MSGVVCEVGGIAGTGSDALLSGGVLEVIPRRDVPRARRIAIVVGQVSESALTFRALGDALTRVVVCVRVRRCAAGLDDAEATDWVAVLCSDRARLNT